MSIALPPPEVPVAVQPAQLPRGAFQTKRRFGAYGLYFHGFDSIDDDEIDQLIAKSTNAELLIVGLENLVYTQGHLTSRLVYSLSGKNLYVAMINRKIRSIRAPADLAAFFSGIVSQQEFNVSQFERLRVLASAYCDRTKQDVRMRFVDAPGNMVDLEMRTEPQENTSPISVEAEVSNYGSRFAGRNLVGITLGIDPLRGYEAALQAKTSPQQFNSASTQGSYREEALNLSNVSAAGVVGLNLRRLDFSATLPAPAVNGRYQEAGLEFSDVFFASLTHRGMYRLRVSYGDRYTENQLDGMTLFSEKFVIAEVTPSFATDFGKERLEVFAPLIAGHSVSALKSLADTRFQLARPLIRGVWRQSDHLSMTGFAIGQWTSNILPESQQWTLGGEGTLSAFTPAALIGDTGFLLRVNQAVRQPLSQGLEWSSELFSEYGLTHRNIVASNSSASEHAADVGLSLGLFWSRNAEISLKAAVPISRPQHMSDTDRAFFYASIKLRL